jgi:DNA-binding MarR family transcriptional regulator
MIGKAKKLFEQIQSVGDKFIALEKGFVFQHEEVKLYPSEIHLMKMVDHNPAFNATNIAKLLGVTKAAISQTLLRLEKKGIVAKGSGPFCHELRIMLTPLGKDALTAFHKHNYRQWGNFARYCERLPRTRQRAISRFFARLEGFLNSRLA